MCDPATLGATPMRDPQKLEELKYRMLIAVADQTIFYDFTSMRRVQKWMPGDESEFFRIPRVIFSRTT